MKRKSINSIESRGKRVLVRLDLNVPLDESCRITDDRRIRAALPTVRSLCDGGGKLILMSHLGRPAGKHDPRFSLSPVAARISELLEKRVTLLDDYSTVTAHVDAMAEGDVCLLENLRFHGAETIKDARAAGDAGLRNAKDEFAGQIAALGDVYVNDAFGTCHRDNASMLTVPQMMEGKPRVAGYLVEKELEFLGNALSNPARPFICILGGAKVSDKLGVIHSLKGKCDAILIGGAMAYTFLASQGVAVGGSLMEPDLVESARNLLAADGARLVIPEDSACAASLDSVQHKTVTGDIPDELMGLDIGPASIEKFSTEIRAARTIVWNGPMGVFETPPFDRGTVALANAVAEATDRGAISIVGGGDSAAAVDRAGVAERMSHISTGGGASIEFLEGKRFAALEVLDPA